jgi:hypothetical protein
MEAEKLYVDDFMTEEEENTGIHKSVTDKKTLKELSDEFSIKSLVSQFILK